MTPLFSTLLFSLPLLLTVSIQELTEACSCAAAHPQQQICHSALVIRAKICSEKVIEDSVHTHRMIRSATRNWELDVPVRTVLCKLLDQNAVAPAELCKMFKGFEKVKDVQYAFTPFDSAACGVKLEANKKKQYLLTGQISDDGRFLIYLCSFIKPWDDLTLSQKINLNQRYEMGCDCKISACYTVPCRTTTPSECLWTDWLTEKKAYGHQAKYYACIKRSDGTCSWYRGGPPVEKEFADSTEP